MALDSGYKGSIMSMSGLRSRPGYGLQTWNESQLVPAAIPGALLLPANPKRVYALIQNYDPVNSVQIYFANDTVCFLYAGDSLLVNKDNPWCGIISAIGSSGDANVNTLEVSLAGPVL